MFENELVGENKKFTFYRNSFTDSLTKYCREENLKGVSLDGWYCLLAVSKRSLSKIYIAVSESGVVMADSTQVDGLAIQIDALKCFK